jgi:hypothetical protein
VGDDAEALFAAFDEAAAARILATCAIPSSSRNLPPPAIIFW